MKKFMITSLIGILTILIGDMAFYNLGWHIPRDNQPEISVLAKTKGKTIMVHEENGFAPFEIRGVDLGTGIPGYFATDYAINKKTYLEWFKLIQEMGANCIRVYTIQAKAFYEAVYQYNKDNDTPLYIIHGVWVDDYVQFSHADAFDPRFFQAFQRDCKALVDVVHGKRRVDLGHNKGKMTYKKDISPWVIGYILGVEWDEGTVAFTNQMEKERSSYIGQYLYTSKAASPFESMLARVGDTMISYETKRYGKQCLVAFSNWPNTDPIDHSGEVVKYFRKTAKVDVEHILSTDRFLSGQFASYHIYPYYPDYLNYTRNWQETVENPSRFQTKEGGFNTYRAYLSMINRHHSMPVVIAEFGVPSSRGMAQRDHNTGRSQGFMSEKDQGRAIVECYEDIKAAGCAGGIIFTWQDEWFKRTWNTMQSVDTNKTPYWSDDQTNEQHFGLLSFDPGKENSVCYVDGETGEWNGTDEILSSKSFTLSMKYDEKYLYFMASGAEVKWEEEKVFIPIDVTPKSGSNYENSFQIGFERPADFLIVLDGRKNSRLLVQERYDILPLTEELGKNPFKNPPDQDSPVFKPIYLLLQIAESLPENSDQYESELYEAGKLAYGNANPANPEFDSLADFCFGNHEVELKIPWQLLHFSNPSELKIHDDYYECYGVEDRTISSVFAGIGLENENVIPMGEFPLKGWNKKPSYHQRLKESYYMVKAYWNGGQRVD